MERLAAADPVRDRELLTPEASMRPMRCSHAS
jgi:hypothetical protein